MTFEKAFIKTVLSQMKNGIVTYTVKLSAPAPGDFLKEMRVDPELLQRMNGLRLQDVWPEATLRFALPSLRFRGHQGYEKIDHARVGPFLLSRVPQGVGVQFDVAWDEKYNHPGESQYLNLHVWVTAMAGPVGQVTVLRSAVPDDAACGQLVLRGE